MASLTPINSQLPAQRQGWLDAGRDLAVPLVGGVLLGLPFYSEQYDWVAWIALVPTAWVLWKPRATAFLYFGSFYGGLAFSLLGLDWMRESYDGKLIDSWLVIGHFLALFYLAAVCLGRSIAQATAAPPVVVLPTIWVAIEWLRWHIAGMPVEDGFPFLMLGTTQIASHRLIQIADIGGIAAVSWLVAAANGAVFEVAAAILPILPTRRQAATAIASSCAAAILVTSAYLYGDSCIRNFAADPGPTIGLVSGTFRFDQLEDVAEEIKRRIEERLSLSDLREIDDCIRPGYPTLLIWKETAASFALADDLSQSRMAKPAPSASFRQEVQPLPQIGITSASLFPFAKKVEASLLVGTKRSVGASKSEYNSVVFITNGAAQCYDKIHLAPWREFRPMLADLMGILPFDSKSLARKQLMQSGSAPRIFSLTCNGKQLQFATTICYDLFFPDEHLSLVGGSGAIEPSFFVCAANEYGTNSTIFPHVSLAIQRFRAIECRRSYVRNAGYGISAVVDGRGITMPKLEIPIKEGQSISLYRVPINRGRSVFAQLGHFLPLLACIFCILTLVPTAIRCSRLACLRGPRP